MISPPIRGFFDSLFCCGLSDDKTLIDHGNSARCLNPQRVGSSILLCGKRKSSFPFHCMVGPDWPIVLLVYVLIVVIDGVVLGVISPLGWPPVLIGIFGMIVLLTSYSFVACSDPGIIYRTIEPEIEATEIDLEESLNNGEGKSIVTTERKLHSMPKVPDTVECGHCAFKRPYSARHCHYCEVCIDDLDHHCPWCGKCIGKNNLKYFHLFLNTLCFQFYYLLGTLIYYLIASYSSPGLPRGPSF